MASVDEYLRHVEMINYRMWAEAERLEKELADLQDAYQAAVRDVRPGDAISAGLPAALKLKLEAQVGKVNAHYEGWRLTLINLGTPPPVPKGSVPLKDRIPFPSKTPRWARNFVVRAIQQEGIPLGKRAALTAGKLPYGGYGVAVIFAKW